MMNKAYIPGRNGLVSTLEDVCATLLSTEAELTPSPNLVSGNPGTAQRYQQSNTSIWIFDCVSNRFRSLLKKDVRDLPLEQDFRFCLEDLSASPLYVRTPLVLTESESPIAPDQTKPTETS